MLEGKIVKTETSKPRYRAIIDQLKLDLESQRYGSGDRLPPDAELARLFKTSRLTVIRALRDLEAEGLVTRKAGSGTYVRPATVRSTFAFGLLMPDLGEGEIFEPISRSIMQSGEALHHTVLWGSAAPREGKDAHREQQAREQQTEDVCEYFISRKISGVFFCPLEHAAHQHEVNRRALADLENAGIPIVMIDRDVMDFPDRSHHDLVGIDNNRAGYRVTGHLLRAGCRRIAFAYRPGAAPPVRARFAGYREAIWAADLGHDGILEFPYEGTHPVSLASFLERRNPDGFVCANDLTAASLMHELLKLGVRIPKDVRMVGINDVKYARFLPVPLTTLRQPCRQIGTAAMSVMLDRLARPDGPVRDVLIDCELVVRASCGTSET